MAATPAAEKPPPGLNAHWLGVWRGALKAMKAQGSWAWEQRPFLDEYVFALQQAEAERAAGKPAAWDRTARRASLLADLLALTPRGRKAAGLPATGKPKADPFADFANVTDLRTRRRSE